MDDFAGSAAAYAWMAAYKSRRVIPGHNIDQDVKDKRDSAADFIHRSMSAVCIRKVPLGENRSGSLCDGNTDMLTAGTAQTLSVNGTVQLIHYGFGLMTSVLSAAQGYEVAGGGPFPFSDPEKAIAKGLYDEIARHTDASGNFLVPADCLKLDQNNAIAGGSPCDGSFIGGVSYASLAYEPNMYQLKGSNGLMGPYDVYFPGAIPSGSGAYTSSTFDGSLFSSDPSAWFGYGRLATYRDMGGDWIPNGAPNMPLDAYDPLPGSLSISPSGLASGWTCDQDAPDKAIRVDFYTGDLWPPVYVLPVVSGYANLASESAVNSACGGGTAHRFQIQLPPSAAGLPIHAFGLDYTWYGFTELTCSQGSVCSFDPCTTASISAQPVSSPATINTGASSTLTVGVNGTSPNIQWYTISGVNIGSGSSITVAPTTTTAYYVTVSNACTSAISSNYVVVNVCDAASITAQPASNPGTIVVGSSANLSIGVSGTSPNIQWYTASGVNVGSGSNISVSPTTTTTYYATVGNLCTSTLTSATVTVTVTCNTATISAQPVSNPSSITLGASVTLTIGVNGTSPNIQWYTSSGTNVGSGSSISLSPTATTTYHATISNFCTSAFNSANVTVSVCVPAGISSQPTSSPSLIILTGGSSTLSIGVTGTSTTVQWYTSTGTLVGSGTSISVSPTVKTFYYAIVSNACGSVQSSQVMVNVCVVATLGSNPTATPSAITAGQTSRLEMAGDSTGTGPFTYLWYKSDGTLVGTSTNKRLTVSPTVTTTYYYKVSNACGTSSASGNVTVTVN